MAYNETFFLDHSPPKPVRRRETAATVVAHAGKVEPEADAATVVAHAGAQLHIHKKGQGYHFDSYWPQVGSNSVDKDADRVQFKKQVTEMFTRSIDIDPNLKTGHRLLPKSKEKLINKTMFDEGVVDRDEGLFAKGVHMPLLVFIGNGEA